MFIFPVFEEMLLTSSFNDFVVNIGDVDLVKNVVAEVVAEYTTNDVK